MDFFFISNAGERGVEVAHVIGAQQRTALVEEVLRADGAVVQHRAGAEFGEVSADAVNKTHAWALTARRRKTSEIPHAGLLCARDEFKKTFAESGCLLRQGRWQRGRAPVQSPCPQFAAHCVQIPAPDAL